MRMRHVGNVDAVGDDELDDRLTQEVSGGAHRDRADARDVAPLVALDQSSDEGFEIDAQEREVRRTRRPDWPASGACLRGIVGGRSRSCGDGVGCAGNGVGCVAGPAAAAAAANEPIRMLHLAVAARREFAKLGRLGPPLATESAR